MVRGRSKKAGLTRMDAALDAMRQFGFPRDKVEKSVKKLLKEYGGNEGWPFIEENYYLLLIEEFFREEDTNAGNDGNQSKEKSSDGATTSAIVPDAQQDDRPENNDDRPENNAPEDVEMPSVVVSKPTPPQQVGSSSRIHNEIGVNAVENQGDGKSWKDIALDKTPGDIKKEPAEVVLKPADDPKAKAQSQKNSAAPKVKDPSILSPPPRRRPPCYGWIDSDDEETAEDFILLKPAPLIPVSKEKPPAVVPTEPTDTTPNKRKRQSRWDL